MSYTTRGPAEPVDSVSQDRSRRAAPWQRRLRSTSPTQPRLALRRTRGRSPMVLSRPPSWPWPCRRGRGGESLGRSTDPAFLGRGDRAVRRRTDHGRALGGHQRHGSGECPCGRRDSPNQLPHLKGRGARQGEAPNQIPLIMLRPRLQHRTERHGSPRDVRRPPQAADQYGEEPEMTTITQGVTRRWQGRTLLLSLIHI